MAGEFAGVSVGVVLQILTTIVIAVAGWFAKSLRDSVQQDIKELSEQVEENHKLAQENAKARKVLLGVDINGDSTQGLRDKVQESAEKREDHTRNVTLALNHIKERLDMIEGEMRRNDNFPEDVNTHSTEWPWKSHRHNRYMVNSSDDDEGDA